MKVELLLVSESILTRLKFKTTEWMDKESLSRVALSDQDSNKQEHMFDKARETCLAISKPTVPTQSKFL